MSDAKRTIAEIQQQYQGLCLRAGHLNYQVYINKLDLETINDALRKLNLEAADVSKADEEAKKAAAVVAVPEVANA